MANSERSAIVRSRVQVPGGPRVHGLRYIAAGFFSALGALLWASTYALHPYGPVLYALILIALSFGSYWFERQSYRPDYMPGYFAPGTWIAVAALFIGVAVVRLIHGYLGTPVGAAISPLAVYLFTLVLPAEALSEPEAAMGLVELLAAILGALV